MDLKNFFSLRPNLSNDNIISPLRPGLKTGMDFRGLVWKQVWKITFFGLKSGQGLKNRAEHPHQEFQGVRPQDIIPDARFLPTKKLSGIVSTATAKKEHKSFTHIKHHAGAVGREARVW